jgi:hypothetical protein
MKRISQQTMIVQYIFKLIEKLKDDPITGADKFFKR